MELKKIHKVTATEFVSERHYSAVMPKLTKHFLGCFENDELVGLITFGLGTRPMLTIQALLLELNTHESFDVCNM